MCGIAGILRRDGESIPEAWINTLTDRIAHRGPDDGGVFRDTVEADGRDGPVTQHIALIHRRLAVIDLDDGHQPMTAPGRDTDEQPLTVAFNGCIYNHRDLRAELQSRGHVFLTDHSDTEVLLHGYREWGRDLESHLEGMYAFALWDRANAALVLARDWFGEKPLYVRWGIDDSTRTIAFSSDAQSLAMLSEATITDQIDTDAWPPMYLQLGYNAEQRTPYLYAPDARARTQPVESIPPTITTQIDDLLDAWKRDPQARRAMRRRDIPAEAETLLRGAVHKRLEADVPLGCFLSGGIDSSLVALYAREQKRDLRTFCVRMPDERYDESEAAADVAYIIDTDHTTLDIDTPDFDPVRDLEFLIDILGMPFGDSSILPTYWISRAARRHVTVALTGDGGDELFLGYERYMIARKLQRHSRVLKWMPWKLIAQWQKNTHARSTRYRIGRAAAASKDLRRMGILALEALCTSRQIDALLDARNNPETRERQPLHTVDAYSAGEPMQSLRRADLIGYLPNDLLLKVDTASMAVALEVRCPFLDRDLAREAIALPTWELAPGMKRKGLLRTIARRHLPSRIVDRPKQGFSIPIGEWFRSDYKAMQQTLLRYLEPPPSTDVFGPIPANRSSIDTMLREHLSGEQDHSQRLFAMLTLAMWAQRM